MAHPIERLILNEIKNVITEKSARIKMKGSEVKASIHGFIKANKDKFADMEEKGWFTDPCPPNICKEGMGATKAQVWINLKFARSMPRRRRGQIHREIDRYRQTDEYKKLIGSYGAAAAIITKIQIQITSKKQLQVFWMKNNPGKEKIQNAFVRHHYTRINSDDDLAGMFCAALKDLEAKKGITAKDLAAVSPNTFFYDTKVRHKSGRPKVTYFRTLDDFVRERAPSAMPCLDGKEREKISKPEEKKEKPVEKKKVRRRGGRGGGRCYYGGPVTKQEMFTLLGESSCTKKAKTEIRKLQKKLGVTVDGKFGPKTGKAACDAGLVPSCKKKKTRLQKRRSKCDEFYKYQHPCDKDWCYAKARGMNFTCEDPTWAPPDGPPLTQKHKYDIGSKEYVHATGTDAWKYCAKKHKPDTDEFGECYAKARSSSATHNVKGTLWGKNKVKGGGSKLKYRRDKDVRDYEKKSEWGKFWHEVFE